MFSVEQFTASIAEGEGISARVIILSKFEGEFGKSINSEFSGLCHEACGHRYRHLVVQDAGAVLLACEPYPAHLELRILLR